MPEDPNGPRTISASDAHANVVAAPREGEGVSGRLSVIISLSRDVPDLEGVHQAYVHVVQRIGAPYEFVYVVCAGARGALAVLEQLRNAGGSTITIVVLRRWPGEARALASGFQQAGGEVVLSLPPRLQVDPNDVPRMIGALDGCDMAIARRFPQGRGAGQGWPEKGFHWLLKATFGHAFSDLMCRVRAYRRRVLEEISHYGVQHHFSPLLAVHRGFTIREVEVRPGAASASVKRRPWTYAGAVLDILALYVLLRFTRKPLRFFGLIGGFVLAAGITFTAALAFSRLVYGIPLGDRPALILGVLLIVLGIQIMALGLIGEIIIFASGKSIRDYSVEKVIGSRVDAR